LHIYNNDFDRRIGDRTAIVATILDAAKATDNDQLIAAVTTPGATEPSLLLRAGFRHDECRVR
jgi:hypothetical protein